MTHDEMLYLVIVRVAHQAGRCRPDDLDTPLLRDLPGVLEVPEEARRAAGGDVVDNHDEAQPRLLLLLRHEL